jgi:hypothetical protein
MKTKFKHFVRGFYGKFKSEGLVYCKYNSGALCFARKYPAYTESEQNKKIGIISKNLKELYVSISAEYKLDLKIYSKLMVNYMNLEEKIPASSYAIYTKMMWKLKKRFPEIDLTTITREEIMKQEYPVKSVVEAMEFGLLLKIEEASVLLNEM